MPRILLSLVWLLSGLLLAGPAAALDEALLDALRQGGHVIYFRHASTDWSQQDQSRTDLGGCDTQRNLSETGRAESRRIGAAFEALDIPVGEVLSSAYCRCKDMARLAFGEFTVSDAVTSVYLHPDQDLRERRTEALRELLASPPETGNRVLIAHMANLQAAKGVVLSEAEAAVYRPDGAGGSELVGRIRVTDWPVPAD